MIQLFQPQWWALRVDAAGSLLHIRSLIPESLPRFLQCQWYFKNQKARDFPGGVVVKNPPADAGDTGSSPGLGRSHMPRSN